jgi:predicted ATP-grasp superfamily ATP-dependent carboligase
MLLGLFRGILNISNLLYGTSFDIDTHISVMFDTSIIEDKSSIRERDLKEVELGIMTIDEYREKWYNVNRRDTSNKTKVDME